MRLEKHLSKKHKIWIDPAKEINATREIIRAGLLTRRSLAKSHIQQRPVVANHLLAYLKKQFLIILSAAKRTLEMFAGR